ncbi:MAG: DUF1801 domain-containing protein [Pseudomonadota bacterium]
MKASSTPNATAQLRALTDLVRETGQALPEISASGGLVETLRWGQTSFMPAKARVGTTVRVDQHDDAHVALYVHCQTSLIDSFRTLLPDLTYAGNRAVLFPCDEPLPSDEIRLCVEAALLYHYNKRRPRPATGRPSAATRRRS